MKPKDIALNIVSNKGNDMADPNPVPPAPESAWKKWIPTNWQSIVSTLVIALITAIATKLGFSPPPAPPVPLPIFPEDWVTIESDDGKYIKGFATGWVPPRGEDKKIALMTVPEFSDTEAGQALGVFGDPDGNAFLWKAAIKVRGAHIPTRNQSSVGSCVGFGFTCAGEYALAVQVASKVGRPQDGNIDIVQEATYAFSRVEQNGGFAPLVGDGSMGSWAAPAIQKFGFLKRGVYGSHDLTKYDTARCRLWGRKGVPDELEPEAKKNLVGGAALVKTAAEAKKALLQGYPIAVCSDVGFAGQSSRDADGFLKARGSWGHCMCLIGLNGKDDSFYCMNSWGEDWVGGPLGAGDPPPGGFWIAKATVDRMLGQGDSYAISDVKGFPRRKLNVDDWVKTDIFRDAINPKKVFGGGIYALAP
jgi:hypothetical protein